MHGNEVPVFQVMTRILRIRRPELKDAEGPGAVRGGSSLKAISLLDKVNIPCPRDPECPRGPQQIINLSAAVQRAGRVFACIVGQVMHVLQAWL